MSFTDFPNKMEDTRRSKRSTEYRIVATELFSCVRAIHNGNNAFVRFTDHRLLCFKMFLFALDIVPYH